MKNFLKHWSGKLNIYYATALIFAIFVVAAFVRFYNFSNRVTFWSEQARSLMVSADYLKKPSLLGQPYFIREDSNSHMLYSGAYFNYSLVPLLLVSNYDPISITLFFALLNLFTGLIIYLAVKKMFNQELAFLSMIIFLFNDFMIYHSLFIWSYNYLPLVGILITYFLWWHFKSRKKSTSFMLGFLCGLGISLQFLFLPVAFLILAAVFWKSKQKISDSIFFIIGIILGNLPMIIFDLKHNFYESRTLFQYFLDTLAGKSNAGFAYYYLLPFWPIFALLGGYIVFKLFKLNRYLGLSLIIIYIFLNLNSSRINWKTPTGMPDGIKTLDIQKASERIANDASNGSFNVAEVLDFDKEAYVLRYFLEFIDKKSLLGITDYPNAGVLYVLSQKGYNFDKSDVWEIYSGGKYKVSVLSNIDRGYAIYKLIK